MRRLAPLLLAATAACTPHHPVVVTVSTSPPRVHADLPVLPDGPPMVTATTVRPARASRSGVERRERAVTPAQGRAPLQRTPTSSTPAPPNTARVSWYAQGSRTASGAAFHADGLTFAHRSMRFGASVRFCRGGACVVATCTDRGPFVGGREFDLSRGAFAAIAPLSAGVADVTWEAQ